MDVVSSTNCFQMSMSAQVLQYVNRFVWTQLGASIVSVTKDTRWLMDIVALVS